MVSPIKAVFLDDLHIWVCIISGLINRICIQVNADRHQSGIQKVASSIQYTKHTDAARLQAKVGGRSLILLTMSCHAIDSFHLSAHVYKKSRLPALYAEGRQRREK